MRLLKPSALTLAAALALAACDSSSLDTTIATETPGVATINVYSVVDNQATVDWNLTSGTFAEHWRLYQNELRVCSGEPTTVDTGSYSASYQTGGCTITLQVGRNDVQVQLCKSDDSSSCSYSPTERIDYEEQTELGAIAWQYFPSSSTTSENEHYLSWSKGYGVNGDYWHIYQNDASACSGSLSYDEILGAQSGGCDVTLAQGVNTFQAQLCQSQPIGIADNCVQSPSASLTFEPDPERILARAIIEELDESLPASYYLNISWSKDTRDGSAGEDWDLSNNGELICQGVLTSDSNGASCQTQLVEGNNQLQVRLCTDIETYSGASCAYSTIVAVEGFDPNPLEPGTITINDSLPEQVSDEPSLTIDWQISDGNGVSSWSVSANGSIYCATTSLDQYHQSGSCPIALENGTNTISVTGCNYGYDNSESCATSATVSTEYIVIPGTPVITSSFPATSYVSEQTLSWERLDGAAADYWLALVNDTSQCSGDLAERTPQSSSCIIELDSGVNAISVRLCISSESGSAYCSDSATEQIELLAPIPAQPEISTAAQIITDDTILLEWSKSSGDNGSYWSAENNMAAVAACTGRPLLSSGSSQSGSCDLPLDIGTNLIVVHLCNDNAASTASCSTSEGLTITRESATPEFTSTSSASVAENTSAVFYTATVSDADSSLEQLSFALSGADSYLFSIDSSGGLSFTASADYESPQDADGDNVYQLSITVTDGANATSQAISVEVTNVDEAPAFAAASQDLPVNENTSGSIYTAIAIDPEQASLTYSASGADAALFTLNTSSGNLAFIAPPDYEIPLDADADNIYQLTITATDGEHQSSQDLAITVSNVNEDPSFATTSVTLSTVENVNFFHTVEAATDEDHNQQLTYAISGADQVNFSFDPATLELASITTLDYETPLDQDSNNIYQLSITASDGEQQSSQDLAITVTNVNEAPSASISVSPDPSSTNLTTLTAVSLDGSSSSDPDGDSLAYTWSQPSSQSIDLSSPNNASTSFTAAAAGTYTFTLTVADGALAGSAEVTLEISSANILPADFTATAASAQVTLNWTPHSGSTTYNIYRSTDPDCELDSYATACTTSAGALFTSVVPGFIDSNLTDGTTYYYWIEALLNGSTQRAASPISATLQPSAITEPIPGTLNDTGSDWGGDYDNGNNSACSSNVSAPQDCHQGRDATHDDDSDGHAGFSFTKLDSSGNALEADAWIWYCVQDNVTGLIWEAKDSSKNSLHYRADKYNWYGTDASTNADAGRADDDGAICYGYDSSDPATYCNTKAFVARVNAAGLCGASDWRIPSMGELRSILDYSREGPSIDTDYFRNTRSDYYWSNIPGESFGVLWPWVIDFDDSGETSRPSGNKIYVRLVRSGQ